VGNATFVKCVPFRGPLKGLFVMKDAVLKGLDLFCEPPILHCGVGLPISNGCEESIHNGCEESIRNGCEESIRNGAKELSIDVRIGGESGLGRPRGHCWGGQSCWARDWKGN